MIMDDGGTDMKGRLCKGNTKSEGQARRQKNGLRADFSGWKKREEAPEKQIKAREMFRQIIRTRGGEH
jgi:hypothetical protein